MSKVETGPNQSEGVKEVALDGQERLDSVNALEAVKLLILNARRQGDMMSYLASQLGVSQLDAGRLVDHGTGIIGSLQNSAEARHRELPITPDEQSATSGM